MIFCRAGVRTSDHSISRRSLKLLNYYQHSIQIYLKSSTLDLYRIKAAKLIPLRNHPYSNMFRILPPKNENFQMKNYGSFNISAQNIDCGYLLKPPRRGGSTEYPQSMFLSGYTGSYIDLFYFWSKHRLWVLVRTASARRFYRVPTIYVFEQK